MRSPRGRAWDHLASRAPPKPLVSMVPLWGLSPSPPPLRPPPGRPSHVRLERSMAQWSSGTLRFKVTAVALVVSTTHPALPPALLPGWARPPGPGSWPQPHRLWTRLGGGAHRSPCPPPGVLAQGARQ